MTLNMIYIVALAVGLKFPRKIHLNTQWGGGTSCDNFSGIDGAYLSPIFLVSGASYRASYEASFVSVVCN